MKFCKNEKCRVRIAEHCKIRKTKASDVIKNKGGKKDML